ncbi:MAG TPA: hypothetical protein VK177_20880 [Flavobacteriales bacterium]|nr:hypothetical protein [Flavobacteriales bacterium]
MDNFLLTVGWWNFGGSILMLFFLYEPIGNAVLVSSTKIFNTPFKLDYWTKLWLGWAAGINVFFGLINVMAVKWGYIEPKVFLIWADIIAYCIFVLLAIWGHVAGRMGSGIYSVYIIFAGWITWGIYCLWLNSALKVL